MPSPLPRLAASLPLPPDLAMCRRVAEHAEILGYESLWIADTGAGPDAFVVAAMAGMVTRNARVGTARGPRLRRAARAGPLHPRGRGIERDHRRHVGRRPVPPAARAHAGERRRPPS